MRKLVILAAATAALAGCSGRGNSLDEFAVARNAPLVIPPDYTLAPPTAGTLSTSAEGAQAQAIEALFGGAAPRSAGETAMLEAAGRDRAALGIRSSLASPDTRVVDKGQTTRSILVTPERQTEIARAMSGQ